MKQLEALHDIGTSDVIDDGFKNPVRHRLRLRGDQENAKLAENEDAIGGMRNPKRSLDKVPGHKQFGK